MAVCTVILTTKHPEQLTAHRLVQANDRAAMQATDRVARTGHGMRGGGGVSFGSVFDERQQLGIPTPHRVKDVGSLPGRLMMCVRRSKELVAAAGELSYPTFADIQCHRDSTPAESNSVQPAPP